MPPQSVPAASIRDLTRSLPRLGGRPTLGLRLRTFWRIPELDLALANGTDPLDSEELTLRAQQLVEPELRTELAYSIEKVLKAVAWRHQPLPGPRIYERSPIEANRSLLLELRARLTDHRPHRLRGLAMSELMIRYGDSCLYRATSARQLEQELCRVLELLDPSSP
jgi:hypothetical protein